MLGPSPGNEGEKQGRMGEVGVKNQEGQGNWNGQGKKFDCVEGRYTESKKKGRMEDGKEEKVGARAK